MGLLLAMLLQAGAVEGAKVEVYKTIGDVELKIWIFPPEGHRPEDRRPAAVFFFGGGWKSGTPRQFDPQARYLASRGMVAATADYRVLDRHGTKATACVEDGKAALRWLRTNAGRLGIDPDRVAAGGGSAGGHVAASTALLEGFEAPSAAVSSVPNALLLFNPALVLGEVEGLPPVAVERLADRLGVDPPKLSPYHHVRKGLPPSLVVHGKEDKTVPYAHAERFAKAMSDAGNRCELEGYEGCGHGFFNANRKGADARYAATVRRMDVFLRSLGWIEGEPAIRE